MSKVGSDLQLRVGAELTKFFEQYSCRFMLPPEVTGGYRLPLKDKDQFELFLLHLEEEPQATIDTIRTALEHPPFGIKRVVDALTIITGIDISAIAAYKYSFHRPTAYVTFPRLWKMFSKIENILKKYHKLF